MPIKLLASIWGALLSGCRQHHNVILAELAVEEQLALEDGSEGEKDSAYVQLSNIYLAANKYDDARRIRRMIGDKGVKKTPGFSTVEVDGEVNTFYAGDVKHKRLSEIHSLLDLVAIDGLGDYDDSVLEGIDVLDNIDSKNEVMQPVR